MKQTSGNGSNKKQYIVMTDHTQQVAQSDANGGPEGIVKHSSFDSLRPLESNHCELTIDIHF